MKQIITVLLLLCSTVALAQSVGIGTTTPHASALLDVSSTTQGFLAPRLTQAQRLAVADPAKGLLVYQTDNIEGLYAYSGTAWVLLGAGGGLSGTGSPGQMAYFRNNTLLGGSNGLFWDTANSRLGIGTITPAKPLDVAAEGGIRISRTEALSANNELYFQNNGQIRSGDNFHRIIFDNNNNTMEFREFGQIVFSPGTNSDNGSGKVSIQPDGNIRVFNPEATTNTEVRLGAHFNRPGVYSSQSLQLFTSAGNPIVFGQGNNEYARIDANGLMLPRLATSAVQNISDPQKGLLLLDSSLMRFKYFDGQVFPGLVPWYEGLTSTITKTFAFTGAVQSFTVPPGVTALTIDAQGAEGGDAALFVGASVLRLYSNGGKGARVQTVLSVTPGQVLHIFVGGRGIISGTPLPSNFAFTGGGGSVSANLLGVTFRGAGGGGATDIRINGTDLSNRIIVAGGGGGTGLGEAPAPANGGHGGLNGGTGENYGANPGGGGGTQTSGGAAAGPGSTAGALGNGGNGAYINSLGTGGGGGGGYYGGGGAAVGGGGGGSSYVDSTVCSSITITSGFKQGAGMVTISYQTNNPIPAPYLSGVNVLNIPAANLTGTVVAANLPANTTLLGNTVNTGNGLVQLSGGNLPALNGSALTNLIAANLTGALPALNGSALTNLTAANLTGALPVLNAGALTNINAGNIATGTLADARLSTNITQQGNIFNGASQLVQLDGTSKLPAVDGSLLTNLSAASIAGIIPVSKGGTGAGSFTAGQLLFGNGTSAVNTSSNLYFNNGNNRLGIGTGAPAKPLHVSGNGGILIDANAFASNSNELMFTDNGQIRSFDDNHRIIFDRANNTIELREYGDIVLSSGALTGNRTGNAVLLGNGNFGIGTSNPLAKLDVNGTAQIAGTLTANGSLHANGQVLIANGVIQKGGAAVTNTQDLGLYSRNNGNWLRFVTNGGDMAFYRSDSTTGSGGNETMRILGTNGFMGIGTGTPTERLEVNGNLKVSGNIKPKVYSFSVSAPAAVYPVLGPGGGSTKPTYGSTSIVWNHNLGYLPELLYNIKSIAYGEFLIISHINNDANTTTFTVTNITDQLALGELKVIVVN